MKRVLFALMGDLTKASWEQLQPQATEVLALMSQHLNPHSVSVCNNATWAIGLIAMKLGEGMDADMSARVVECLIPMLNQPRRYHRSLLDTSSATIGRLSIARPDVLGALVDRFIIGWSQALRNCYDDEEKEHATLGMLAVLRANPAAAAPNIGYVCDVFCSWNVGNLQARPVMAQGCTETLHAFKLHLGTEQWPLLWKSLHPSVQTQLTQTFGVTCP
jgi:transportin-1